MVVQSGDGTLRSFVLTTHSQPPHGMEKLGSLSKVGGKTGLAGANLAIRCRGMKGPDMADDLSRIDVVVTVIYCDDSLLMVFNDKWGAFTIPMTKLRHRPLGTQANRTRWELGADAAMRNVGECLGITSDRTPGLLADVGDVRQSERDGRIRFYHFQVYGFRADRQQAAAGVTAKWLAPDEILDSARSPISPTARALVERLGEIALVQHCRFPPAPAPDPRRQSVASIAIIRRTRGDRKQWLCQWNQNWGRYFLVGGHQEPGEDAEACLVREMQEELVFAPGTDYELAKPPRVLEYADWSASTWQETDYRISAFDVELEADARGRVDRAAENRWITKEEILSERCADEKLVSPTARKVLEMLGEL